MHLKIAFEIFTGHLVVKPNRLALGTPARHSKVRGEDLPFLLRVVNYGNKLSASVVTAPSVNIFKDRVCTKVFSHLPV